MENISSVKITLEPSVECEAAKNRFRDKNRYPPTIEVRGDIGGHAKRQSGEYMGQGLKGEVSNSLLR